MSPQPNPGWYPDPSSPTQLRWWDGASWSSATQPFPSPQVAPGTGYPPSGQTAAIGYQPSGQAPAATFTPSGQEPYGWSAAPGTTAPAFPPERTNRTLLWVLVGVLVVGLIGGVVALTNARTRASAGPGVHATPPTSKSAPVNPSPSATTPSVAAASVSLADRAKKLGGTPFVAKDGSSSMVVSSTWSTLDSVPNLGALPAGLAFQNFWMLPSADPAAQNVGFLMSGTVAGLGTLDNLVTDYLTGEKTTAENFVQVSRESVQSDYGADARIVRFRMTSAGQPLEGITFFVLENGHVAILNVVGAGGSFDPVLAQVMPFVTTVAAPADV